MLKTYSRQKKCSEGEVPKLSGPSLDFKGLNMTEGSAVCLKLLRSISPVFLYIIRLKAW